MGNDKANYKIILAVFIIFCIMGVAVAGCAVRNSSTKSSGENASASGGIEKLVIGTTNVPDGVNIEDSNFQRFSYPLVFEGLVRMSPSGEFLPWLAVDWSTSDSRNWTFHLVPNATFQDGVPVTSADVKFTIYYLKTNSSAGFRSQFSQVASVDTPDGLTVVVRLKTANSNCLVDLSMFRVLPEHVFRNITETNKYNDINATIGSGPYRFVGYDKAAGIMTFEAKDDYRYGKPAIGTIEVRTFKNEDTMMMALEKGEIDTVYMYSKGISYYYVPALIATGDVRVMTIPQIGIAKSLFYNTKTYPYNMSSFREALTYAVNYEELNSLFTAGYGSMPDAGFVTNGTLYYVPTRKMEYDVNKSKAMLDAMGFMDVDGDGFREYPNGTAFRPDLTIAAGSSENARLLSALKAYFNAVGLNVNARALDKTVLSDQLTRKTHEMTVTSPSNYGMMMWAGYGTGFFDNRSVGNAVVDDPGFLALVDGLLNTTDEVQKARIAAELQYYYANETPAFPLYLSDLIQPYNGKYEGYVASPFHGIMSMETIYGLHDAQA